MKKEWSVPHKIQCYAILMLTGAWFGSVLTAIWYIGSTFTVGNWIYTGVFSVNFIVLAVMAFRALGRIRIMEKAVDRNNRLYETD